MPRYLVSQKVRTVADLFGEHRIDQFVLRPFDRGPGGRGEDAWEVRNEIEASDFREAFKESRTQLVAMIDSIAVVTQCVASMTLTSFFVFRQDQNADRQMLYVARRERGVGITLWEAEQTRPFLDDFGALAAMYEVLRSNYDRGVVVDKSLQRKTAPWFRRTPELRASVHPRSSKSLIQRCWTP